MIQVLNLCLVTVSDLVLKNVKLKNKNKFTLKKNSIQNFFRVIHFVRWGVVFPDTQKSYVLTQ